MKTLTETQLNELSYKEIKQLYTELRDCLGKVVNLPIRLSKSHLIGNILDLQTKV